MLSIDNDDINVFSPDIKCLSIDKVLNFNYTTTYSRIYGEVDCCFIHGKAGDGNLVLGYRSDDDEDGLGAEFEKFFQRIHRDTDKSYRKWLEENNSINVFFFGHSMGDSDENILEHIMCHPNVETSTVFYYSEEDHESKIKNLSRILGKQSVEEWRMGGKLVIKSQAEMKKIVTETGTLSL